MPVPKQISMVLNGGMIVPAGRTRECDMAAAADVQDCMVYPLIFTGLDVMLDISVRSAPDVAYEGIVPCPVTLFHNTSVIRMALFAFVASAFSWELPPAHIFTGVAVAVTAGNEYTFTVTVAVFVQAFAAVEVTVYVVVPSGLATTTGPDVGLKLVVGDQA